MNTPIKIGDKWVTNLEGLEYIMSSIREMQTKECDNCSGSGVEIIEIERGGYYGAGISPYVDIIEKERECEDCNGFGYVEDEDQE